MKVPTDLEILSKIYDMYYEEFSNFTRGEENGRQTKIYLPINCAAIASELGVDADIVFGRLYYHLNNQYGYRKNDGSNVPFFELMVGSDSKCVNFPLLASVLAGLQDENRKFTNNFWISVVAIVVSAVALGVTIFEQLSKNAPVVP